MDNSLSARDEILTSSNLRRWVFWMCCIRNRMLLVALALELLFCAWNNGCIGTFYAVGGVLLSGPAAVGDLR